MRRSSHFTSFPSLSRPPSARPRSKPLAPRAGEAAYLVPGLSGEVVNATFKFKDRHATFRNEFGLFLVDDATGRIGNLQPRDRGYARAALERRHVVFTPGQKPGAVTNLELPAGRYFGTYLIQHDTSSDFLARNPKNGLSRGAQAFFSFTAANPDHIQHVRQPAPNVQAWEDQTHGGDRDFNDAVVEFAYTLQSDTTAPVVTIVTPSEGLLTRTNTTVSGTVRDDLSGVKTLQGSLDAGASFPVTFDSAGHFLFDTMLTTDGSSDGRHVVSLKQLTTPATSQAHPRLFRSSSTPSHRFSINVAGAAPWVRGADPYESHDRRPGDGRDLGRAATRGPCRQWALHQRSLDQQGNYSFTPNLAIDGSADGLHSVFYRSTDKVGNSFADLPGPSFTLDTTPPPVSFDLDPTTDSAPLGDQQTTFNPMTLDGQTEPNLPVKLVETGATTIADAAGKFSFTGVPLPVVGANPFQVQATDAAGNVGTGTNTIILIQPPPQTPCVFNDLTGWTTSIQGGTPTGQGTIGVQGDRVVMSEGDSFHVALERTFVIPAGTRR